MSTDVKGLLDNIKSMQYFEVTIELHEPLAFNGGKIPFDINIVGDMATFNVLAESYADAEQKVWEYINSLNN